jgi:hypothetical protein
MLGGRGTLTQPLDQIAEIFGRIEDRGLGRINIISGNSMGGASAQYISARLATRPGSEQAPPPMVLLDPQLLNNRHAAWAARSAKDTFQFDSPRGIAISLDSPTDPRKNLMGKLKSYAGYRHPGILELKMPTLPNDAVQVHTETAAPQNNDRDDRNARTLVRRSYADPRPVWHMGYHVDPQKGLSIYEAVMKRFVDAVPSGTEPSNTAVL